MKFDKKVKLEIQLAVAFLVSLILLLYFLSRRDGGDAFAVAGFFFLSIAFGATLYNTFKKKSK